MRALDVSHVAHPDLRFPTPSGKVEFYSERAAGLGLPPLPVHEPLPPSDGYPLAFRQGRTLAHFHGFYDHGRALPSLARLESEPELWLAPADATARGVADGAPIRIFNQRGEFEARARVTDRVPAGTVWMRDGWTGLNRLTSGAPAIPDGAVEAFGFSAGQSAFDAMVEVAPR
jgi:anaerobic selenocysteine-containing dehydrogenase